MLQELPQCDRDTKWADAGGHQCGQTRWTRGCHRPSSCTKPRCLRSAIRRGVPGETDLKARTGPYVSEGRKEGREGGGGGPSGQEGGRPPDPQLPLHGLVGSASRGSILEHCQ